MIRTSLSLGTILSDGLTDGEETSGIQRLSLQCGYVKKCAKRGSTSLEMFLCMTRSAL